MSRAAIQNTNYLVTVTQNNLQVNGILPETFEFSITSEYDTPYASGLVDNEMAKNALRAFGVSTTTQAQTAQTWQGSSPIDITIPMMFMADSDPIREVKEPILNLLKLATARALEGDTLGSARVLVSPGPKRTLSINNERGETTLVSKAQSLVKSYKLNDQIRLDIGNAWTFKSVVITNVSNTYDTIFDVDGNPLKASVNVSFRTYFTPLQDDLDAIFRM